MINKKNLSIIACLIFLIGFVGSLLTYRSFAAVQMLEKKVIDNTKVSIVNIDTENARVNIYPTKENNIKVIVDGKTSTNIKRTFDTNVEDSTLFITYNEKQRSWFNFDIFEVLDPLTLKVYLPEKQYDTLKVSSHNGYVRADQLKTTTFETKTTNGKVELKDIHSQNITAESHNGLVNLRNITTENTFVKSDNGNITLDQVKGKLDGETYNGNISLITKKLEQNINFNTHNGRINIETGKEPTNVQFNISVENGRVNILDKYNGNAVIGKGENLVKLTTHNGNISVVK